MGIRQTWLERSNEIELPGWVCKALLGFIWEGIGSLPMSSLQSLEVALNSVSSSLTIFFPARVIGIEWPFVSLKLWIYNLIFVDLWAQMREAQVQKFSVIFYLFIYLFSFVVFCFLFFFRSFFLTRGLCLESMTVQKIPLSVGDSGGFSWDSLGDPFCSPSEHDSSWTNFCSFKINVLTDE